MEERKFEQIQKELLPPKSKLIYEKEWNRFDEFLLERNYPSVKEKDGDLELKHYSEYFEYLHATKQLNGSTIWQRYSMLNSQCKLYLGYHLQQKFPQLTPQLQAYDRQAPKKKKAGVFEYEELKKFWLADLTKKEGKILTAKGLNELLLLLLLLLLLFFVSMISLILRFLVYFHITEG